MHNFKRFIRQNKKKIIKVVLIIAFLFGILQLLNYLSKIGIINTNSGLSKDTTDNIYKETNGTVVSSKSAVSGSKVSDNKIKSVNSTIEEFIKYCNNHNIQEAYNMLTDECKELLYPDLNTFKTNYIDRIFYITRMYGLENWYDSEGFFTYYIKYTEDVLATGSTNSRR